MLLWLEPESEQLGLSMRSQALLHSKATPQSVGALFFPQLMFSYYKPDATSL